MHYGVSLEGVGHSHVMCGLIIFQRTVNRGERDSFNTLFLEAPRAEFSESHTHCRRIAGYTQATKVGCFQCTVCFLKLEYHAFTFSHCWLYTGYKSGLFSMCFLKLEYHVFTFLN